MRTREARLEPAFRRGHLGCRQLLVAMSFSCSAAFWPIGGAECRACLAPVLVCKAASIPSALCGSSSHTSCRKRTLEETRGDGTHGAACLLLWLAGKPNERWGLLCCVPCFASKFFFGPSSAAFSLARPSGYWVALAIKLPSGKVSGQGAVQATAATERSVLQEKVVPI